MELVVARNPDAGSSLPYLLHVPIGDGLVFRTRDVWPRTSALYCHPVELDEWPDDPDVVERVPLRACTRRGAAIDVIADRTRERRSQIVTTQARGRQVVFWQSPRSRKQSRPDVRLPTARAGGIPDLEILVDAHERYPYRFTHQQAVTERRALPCGDYGVEVDGRLVAAVERKTLEDLTSSALSGRLGYALGDLAALPRAAVVVEDRYARVFQSEHVRPAVVADALAELQVRWPSVPIVFCGGRGLAEEWTYRWLAAAQTWVAAEATAGGPIPATGRAATANSPQSGPPVPTAEIRRWARRQGWAVADRGRMSADVLAAWRSAHPDRRHR